MTAELSVTARRTASHYGHRAWPLLLLDTGHAAAALLLAARALGAGEPEARLDGPAGSPPTAVHIPPPGADTGPRPPRDTPTPAELLARRSDPPPLPGTPPPDALRAVLTAAAGAGAANCAGAPPSAHPTPAWSNRP
ncbi:hypothetical protein LUW77_26840 [Streptomyces radiopugnans]|nr:hypothetical protein LUW77_26840 [Streptomyces radiopugnans]